MRAFNEAWNANRLGRATTPTSSSRASAAHEGAPARHQRGEDRDATVGARWRRRGVRCVVRNLSASGVRIIGDLARLTDTPASRRVGDAAPDPAIPPEVAASMAIGVLLMGGFAQAPATDDRGAVEAVARITSRRIGGVIYRRVRDAADQRVRSARDRVAHQGRRG